GVVVIAPRVRTRLDRGELVAAVVVGERAAHAVEVRVQRRGPAVAGVPVTPARVGLPDLDQRVWHRPPVAVQQPAEDDDALPDRLAGVLHGQVVVALADSALAEQWTGHLGEPLRQQDQLLPRVAQRRGAVL